MAMIRMENKYRVGKVLHVEGVDILSRKLRNTNPNPNPNHEKVIQETLTLTLTLLVHVRIEKVSIK